MNKDQDFMKDSLIRDAKINKELFDLCKNNEGLKGTVHILDQSDSEKEGYRIYHSGGYCMDVMKIVFEREEGQGRDSEIDGYEYEFYSEYDGFRKIKLKTALKAIQIALKKNKS